MNRREFLKFSLVACGIALSGVSIFTENDNVFVGKSDNVKTLGGWAKWPNDDGLWHYQTAHITGTDVKQWYDTIFAPYPHSIVFVADKLDDKQIRDIYYKTKPFFGDKVDESIEDYL